MSEPVPPSPTPAPPARRKRRWPRRIFISLAALLLLAVVTVQIAISTDLPRNLVVNAVERQFGLRMTAGSLSTGWFGNSTFHDVVLSLPLSDKPIVTIPTLEISHTNLLWMAITRSISIDRVEADQPTLRLVQDWRGNWNLQEMLARISAASAPSPGAAAPSATPSLPELQIVSATILVMDNQHRSATISDLNVFGSSHGALVWVCDATSPQRLDVQARIAPGGPWQHEVTMNLRNMGQWMLPWMGHAADSAQLQAHWRGQIDPQAGWIGRLTIDQSRFGPTWASGPVDVAIGSAGVTLNPAGLAVGRDGMESMPIELNSGTILVSSGTVHCQKLSLGVAGGEASLDGQISLDDGAASLRAQWQNVALPASFWQSGSLTVQYAPSLESARLMATLQSQAVTPYGTWNAELDCNGLLDAKRSFTASLNARTLHLTGKSGRSLDLGGLTAELTANPQNILLQNLRLGRASPRGQVGYVFADSTAWATLSARDWVIPGAGPNSLDLDFDAWANPGQVQLTQLYLKSHGMILSANGQDVFSRKNPVLLHVYIHGSREWEDEQALLGGWLVSHFDLSGTLTPRNLDLTGELSGHQVEFNHRLLGQDIQMTLRGGLNPQGLWLSARNVKLFEGDWAVHGYWEGPGEPFRLDELAVDHLSLSEALARPDVVGSLNADLKIDVHQWSLDGIEAKGTAKIDGLKILSGASTRPVFAADSVQAGQVRLSEGWLNVDSEAKQSAGHAKAQFWMALDTPTQLYCSIDASDWPISGAGPLDLAVGAKGSDLQIDLSTRGIYGSLDAQAQARIGAQPVGQLQATLDLQGRQAAAQNIHVTAFDGAGDGSTQVDLDNVLATRVSLKWHGVDLARLGTVCPSLSDLSGRDQGDLEIAPATTPRPLEPLAISIVTQNQDARGYDIPMGDVQAHGFIGPDRIVLDNSPERPSRVYLAGGYVDFWAWYGRHGDHLGQAFVQLNLSDLNLDRVIPQNSKISKAPGVLNGQVTFVVQPGNPQATWGQGHLRLTHSDLAGVAPIAFLYNLMHFGHNPNKPVGEGTVDLTLHGDTLDVTALRYFDRGAEVRAYGVIHNLHEAPASPYHFTAVGEARPLAALNLPVVTDIDTVLSALQGSVQSIEVTGTLNKVPTTKPIFFGAIGQELRQVIFGDASGLGGAAGE